MTRLPAVLAIAAAAGCASSTGVVPIGPDTYMVAAKAMALGAIGYDAAAQLYQEAGAYCASSGKELMPVSVQSTDGAPGRFPNAKLEFRCLSKGDPQLGRPTLVPAPNIRIENVTK